MIDTRLRNACALLLEIPPRKMTALFLEQLDVAVVRRAWRRIAVSSHPDAARRGGGTASKHDGTRFIEASQAYELVMGHLLRRPSRTGPVPRSGPKPQARKERDRREQGGREQARKEQARKEQARKEQTRTTQGRREQATSGSASGRRSTTEKRGSALFYHGPVPRRRLRLAEFLYYTGRVSWQSLIGAIVWQRAAQPRFGELARELRSISAQDLHRILGSRLRHEHTGQAAQRLRLLTAADVERILRLQRARRRPIGRYFVEKEGMTAAQLALLLRELYRHNVQWAGAKEHSGRP
jgi:hypothetical protein